MTKTIFITGASSGIGKATSTHFAQMGWNVVATMRSPDGETELSELENVMIARLDVLEEASIASAVDEAISRFGRIDVLLNNAGYGAYGPLESTPMSNVRRQFDVNVIGLLATTKALLPHFRQNRSGIIINVASMGGKITFPLGSLYHGSKFAVEGISEALHWEMKEVGVTVKIVEPGMVKTDFGGRSFNFNNDPAIEEYQELVAKVANGFGMAAERSEPEDVAAVIYEAASDGTDKMRYIAGADAKMIIELRKEHEDAVFHALQREQMGL